MEATTRWGIAASGKISQDFVNAIQSNLSSNDHVVNAVASRNIEAAKEFATRFNIPKAFEGYEQLAEQDDVDVVYVGTINPQHTEVVKMMFEGGKHVLCEKPMTMNLKNTKELIALAKEKSLFLMEALWTRFNPVYAKSQEAVDQGLIGEVKVVNSSFGMPIENVDRIFKKELGGGTMLDLGVYCVYLVTSFLGYKDIRKISASGVLFNTGVDKSISGTLHYKGDKMGRFLTYCSATCTNLGEVIGTKGIIKIHPPFWCATRMTVEDADGKIIREFEVEAGNEPKHGPYNFVNSGHLHHEAEHVRQCLQQGLKESPKLTYDETIAIAEILEKCRKAVGVEYPQDH